MTELTIPQAATDAAFALAESYDGDESTGLDREIRRIAAPVVAAELRRLAQTIAVDEGAYTPAVAATWQRMADRLIARANELDGGA